MSRLNKITAVSTAVALALSPFAVIGASAQTAPDSSAKPQAAQTQQAQTKVDTSQWDDATLDAFVSAAVKVGDVQNDYMQKISATKDADEKTKLVQEANAASAKVVKEQPNITVAQYVDIGRAANSDQEFGQKLADKLRKKRAEG